MSKPRLNNETWQYLSTEIADYILEYSSLDSIWQRDNEGNEMPVRTEEKQEEFLDIVDTVEAIMRNVLVKQGEVQQ
jgi:hypothetical protein